MNATRLGRVQLRIMQTLWKKGRSSARGITDELNLSEPIAHSTVQTLLRGLEDKGAIAHDVEERTFVFYPMVREDKYKRSVTKELVQRVFGGSVGDLMAHLLKNEKVSPLELRELRRLIDERRKD